MSYLRTTNNQYFITTHSGHFLDAEDAAIFHVRLNELEESVVEDLRGPSHRAGICFDLGYRPSDLVQANVIIWVEGPSDRIYVRAWIASVEPELVEGTHYSIMFYGGKLLSHLTATDDEITDFIDLLRLNRNVVILMDRDKGNKNDTISGTKDRVANEVSKPEHGGLAWITAGREIENYLLPETLATSLEKVHPDWVFPPTKNEWSCCYQAKPCKEKGPKRKTDKIRLAREAIKSVHLDRLDLRERVNEVVSFIKKHNK